MSDLCYPCSVYEHRCVQEEGYAPPERSVSASLVPARSGCQWFDVAFWLDFGRDLFPAYVGYMEVPDAFSAIEGMMRFYRLWSISYASVRALDGSLVYRAYRVWVDLRGDEDTV